MEPAAESELVLPFPHGVEIELQLLERDGSWIRGEEIVDIFEKIVSGAMGRLEDRIRSAEVASVRRKYRGAKRTEEGERGSRIVASYENPRGEVQEYTVLGHDPNVTSITWILEVATPPCTTAEELAWWIQTLIAISYESIPKESRVILISTGLNPTQEYFKNLSFGEHHHILGPGTSDEVRLAVYNMIRNFIPHLIALSVNSPFENKRPTDEVEVDDTGRVRAPRCKRSIRLLRNTTQLGPISEFEFVPYMRSMNPEFFARHVKRSFARMVDIYPFTDYETIELRVFDTQLSIPRRVGIALILQALALKAKKMVHSGQVVPDMGAKFLAANRASAVAAGLWGPFRPGSGEENPEFAQIYNFKIEDNGAVSSSKRNRFLGDAVVSMLFLIREELEELGLTENPFMQALFVSIFGSEYVKQRTTCADYQLEVYASSDLNMVVLLRRLWEVTRECCTNWLHDPLQGTPQLPTWLCWWRGLEPEIVVCPEPVTAGELAEFTLLLKNTTTHDLRNIVVTYTVEDADRRVVERSLIPIAVISGGEVRSDTITFVTSRGVPAYNILVTIDVAGRQINMASTIRTYWTLASIRPRVTTQFADGQTPVLFTCEIESNHPESRPLLCRVKVVAPRGEAVLCEALAKVTVESDEPTILTDKDFPALVIPADASDRVEKCVLQISVTDAEGHNLSEAVSRPFYVGFLAQRPALRLKVDTMSSYRPGDVIRGEIEVPLRGPMRLRSPKLAVRFVSDKNVDVTIAEFDSGDLVQETPRFRWRIPAILPTASHGITGRIVAVLTDDGETIAEVSSDPFEVVHVGVELRIDSFRMPSRLGPREELRGWLRLRRNTEEGNPSTLRLRVELPDGTSRTIFTQSVRPVRNLSVAVGPFNIDEFLGESRPSRVKIVADLIYKGAVVDVKACDVALSEEQEAPAIQIVFTGVPPFVQPDDSVEAVVELAAEEKVEGDLLVGVETVSKRDALLDRHLILEAGERTMFPIPFQVPLAADMSTGFLIATFDTSDSSVTQEHRFKVKAIDWSCFTVSISILDEDGREIPGLVPKATLLRLQARVEAYRPGIEDIKIRIKIMTRREVVDEFTLPLDFSGKTEQMCQVEWLAPAVDMVTGYYVDVFILQHNRPLPSRAIDCRRKRFTVY
ncbi:MAG: hypothetical protein DRO93_06870 [Candidatus Thorarchaeota archaeon]|nr:MAG: hypothetical protein DRO93_06870 [Candidatus Thorarchaeota archaeon]